MHTSRRDHIGIRYLGGATALLEMAGLRLLTDPTFDPPGDHPAGPLTLSKTVGPAAGPDEIGPADAVLLSHDQHPDNLDDLGRSYLATAPLALSTEQAKERIGHPVRALAAWEQIDLPTPDGPPLQVTGVPARHGPPGCEPYTGAVTGFVLAGEGLPTIYISGDNAALEHVQAVADRFGVIDVAVLFVGAARTPLFDGAPLTLTSAQAVQAAEILGARHVVPVHFEGWAHFSDGRDSLQSAFTAANLGNQLHLLALGEHLVI